MSSLGESLRTGIAALGQDPASHPRDKYVSYIQLLQRWNKAYNLSGIRDPGRMLTHHVLDSLAVLPYLQGVHCLDVGSGAGLPGLILALARPGTRWVLLDSNGKKVRFLNHCLRELGVGNAEVAQARAESYRAATPFDTIISRALGSLEEFYLSAARLLADGGALLAMKGPAPAAEVTPELSVLAEVETIPLQVPGVEGGRTLVRIRPKGKQSDTARHKAQVTSHKS
ncbi:MAG: 16S rRNA (guanine(527)-N(7))-methyltransferase RsmG [Gammaproteobacteria bacterium]|nr:16S rRNA (guanine(527)-N(7))-methyltransferase RsmG [Gammaproteobacteria bacterium]